MADQENVFVTADLMKEAVQSKNKKKLVKLINKLPSRMNNDLYEALNRRTETSRDTMLDVALKKGDWELASIVKGAGCQESDLSAVVLDINHPFVDAFKQRNLPLLEYMAFCFPHMINAKEEDDERTVLHLSVLEDNVDENVLKCILRCGADLEDRDSHGDTPLILAARKAAISPNRSVNVCHILMKAGASVHAVNGNDSARSIIPDIYSNYV